MSVLQTGNIIVLDAVGPVQGNASAFISPIRSLTSPRPSSARRGGNRAPPKGGESPRRAAQAIRRELQPGPGDQYPNMAYFPEASVIVPPVMTRFPSVSKSSLRSSVPL